MTSGDIPSKSPLAETVDTLIFGHVLETLTHTTEAFAAWASLKNTDSLFLVGVRNQQLASGDRYLQDALSEAPSIGLAVHLVLPEAARPVHAYSFGTNAYDLPTVENEAGIEPGQTVAITSRVGSSSEEAYYGNPGCYIKLADLAEALHAGGALDVVRLDIQEAL